VAPATALRTVFDFIPTFRPFLTPRHGPLTVHARPAGQVSLVTFKVAHRDSLCSYRTDFVTSLWRKPTTDFTKWRWCLQTATHRYVRNDSLFRLEL